MIYKEFYPDTQLVPYIDAFWTASGSSETLKTDKILPDGCIDIIINLGEDCITEGDVILKHHKTYLVGTMTRFKETCMSFETNLLGIRFKPGAFSLFYNFTSLQQVANKTIEFEKKFVPDIDRTLKYSTNYLNEFFINNLNAYKHNLMPVIESIQKHKGQIKIEDLAGLHCTTTRQLERQFKQYIGVSPKELVNLIRYQNALNKIQNKHSKTSLLEIAFDCGYYDHSHLSNEVKRYTGMLPSQF